MPLPRCAESESAAGRGAQVSGARLSPLLSLPLLSPRRRADPDQSRSVTPPRRAPLGEKVGRGEVASRRATRGRADRSLAFARREGIDAREKMSGEKRAPKRSGRTGASALRLRGAPRVAAYFDFRTAKGGGGGVAFPPARALAPRAAGGEGTSPSTGARVPTAHPPPSRDVRSSPAGPIFGAPGRALSNERPPRAPRSGRARCHLGRPFWQPFGGGGEKAAAAEWGDPSATRRRERRPGRSTRLKPRERAPAARGAPRFGGRGPFRRRRHLASFALPPPPLPKTRKRAPFVHGRRDGSRGRAGSFRRR